MSNLFDFEEFKAQAIDKLKTGVPLSGKDRVLAPLLENLLNSALEGETGCHLEGVERKMGNGCNGHMSKQVQTSMWEITINTHRDCDDTFDPQIVRKREKTLAASLKDRIIDLYAIGNSTREISYILEEQFGNRIFGRDHKQHNWPCPSRDKELENWSFEPCVSHRVAWCWHHKVMNEKERPVTRARYNVLNLSWASCQEKEYSITIVVSESSMHFSRFCILAMCLF